MARTEHLLALAKAAIESDRERALSLCQQIIAGERPQSGLRMRLERILKSQPRSAGQCDSPIWRIPKECEGLVEQRAPSLPLDDVLLPEGVAEGVGRFLAERRHVDALRAAGLPPSHRILLSGPPGNGKTTLAGAIADALGVPFVVMDYSRVIASYMGNTGAHIAKVFRGLAGPQGLATPQEATVRQGFQWSATSGRVHPSQGLTAQEGLAAPQGLVLFVDEMETLLTERDRDKGDVGEIARVTSSLLLEIDRLPDHVVLIGATNHPEMLDRAVARRWPPRPWRSGWPTSRSRAASAARTPATLAPSPRASSAFRTMKYHPGYPGRFATLDQALAWSPWVLPLVPPRASPQRHRVPDAGHLPTSTRRCRPGNASSPPACRLSAGAPSSAYSTPAPTTGSSWIPTNGTRLLSQSR